MPLVADDLRIETLQRLVCSAPLMALAGGECLHKLFRSSCLGPPVSRQNARSPEGTLIAPLWEDGGRIYGLRCPPESPDFIRFSLEYPGEAEFIAATEQGFWAHRFDFFYEGDASLADLREAARLAQFRFLDMYLEAQEAAEDQLGTFQQHRAWLGQLIEDIDRQASGR